MKNDRTEDCPEQRTVSSFQPGKSLIRPVETGPAPSQKKRPMFKWLTIGAVALGIAVLIMRPGKAY